MNHCPFHVYDVHCSNLLSRFNTSINADGSIFWPAGSEMQVQFEVQLMEDVSYHGKIMPPSRNFILWSVVRDDSVLMCVTMSRDLAKRSLLI